MVWPSISVVNCGYAFRRASSARQSKVVRQCSAQAFTWLSATPYPQPEPGISSVHRVRASRSWRSSSSACGTSTRKGWMVLMAASSIWNGTHRSAISED